MLPAIFSRFRLTSCFARFVLIVNFVFHLSALRSWPSFGLFGWLVLCRVYYPVLFSWSDYLWFFLFLTFLKIFLLFPRYCSFRFFLLVSIHVLFCVFLCRLLPLLSLPFVSSFRFFAGFSNCFLLFFFQVVSSIRFLSDFPRYPIIFIILQSPPTVFFLCNFPRFFSLFTFKCFWLKQCGSTDLDFLFHLFTS